jgi:hypothetical protein
VLQTKNEEGRFLFSPLHVLTLETKKKNCVKIHLMLKSSSLERIAHYYRELDNNNSNNNNNHISSRAFLFAALSLSRPPLEFDQHRRFQDLSAR